MNIKKHLSGYIDTIFDMARQKKWAVWTIVIVVTFISFYGMTKIKFDMTIEGWFGADAPVKVALDEFRAEFGSDDGIYIVYKPADGDVFSAKSLETIRNLREDILNRKMSNKESALKHILKVNTLANATILSAEEDLLISKSLVGNNIPTDQQELDKIRTMAESQKTFPLFYFSKDMKFGGIAIETDFGTERMDALQEETDPVIMNDMDLDLEATVEEEPIRFKATDANDYFAIMEEINVILEKPEYKDQMQFYVVGNAAMAAENMNILNREGGPIYLGLLLVMAVLIWFFARSFSAVVWSLSVVILSVVWTIGIFGLFETTISAFVMLTVMLILTVGVCDATHVFSAYTFLRNEGMNREKIVSALFRGTRMAMIITAVTNAIGMIANVITPIPHIQVFAVMSAIGVIVALLLTLFVLPVMLDLWAPKAENNESGKKNLTEKMFPNFALILQKIFKKIFWIVKKSPVGILISGCIVFGLIIYGVTKVTVDQNLATQFAEGNPFRQAVNIIDEKMMGSQNMEIYLDLNKIDAFQDPFVLNKMDELQRKLEKDFSEVIVKTSSLVETVKDANQTLNEGKEDMYLLPNDQWQLSQTLYLFNNANPEDRRKLVSDNYDKSHITIQMRNRGSKEYLEIYQLMQTDIDHIVSELKQHYPQATVSMTGLLPLNLKFADYISQNEVASFALALITITIIMMFVFGSFNAGLIALVPNLIPTLLSFAILGYAGKGLDIDVMIIMPVLIGISVDDTVHFINHYRNNIRKFSNVREALIHTISEVGQATVFTSLVIGCGFGIMAFSDITGTAYAGMMGAISIFAGVISEIFLLPALILFFKPTFQKRSLKKVD